MVKERCWGCKKVRNDVKLCATDDRLSQSCYRMNEEQLELAASRHPIASKGGTPTTSDFTFTFTVIVVKVREDRVMFLL